MTGDQALVVALIGLTSLTLALGLMTGLWIFGLRVLDGFSRRYASFELIVALGHLRGRKSGYLKMMTGVVLLAMTMANWTLPTVLSVMGGFGNDLKQKILDATAHILIDAERPDLSLPVEPGDEDFTRLAKQLAAFPETKVIISSGEAQESRRVAEELIRRGVAEGRLELRSRRSANHREVRLTVDGDERVLSDYEPLLTKVAAIEGVVGVTPFIDADVMLASQTNIAAVVLKGVDPATMDSVIGLRRTMEQGKLVYLDEPQRILPDVLAEQERRLQLFLDEAGLGERRDGSPTGSGGERDGGSNGSGRERDGGSSGGGLVLGQGIEHRPDGGTPTSTKQQGSGLNLLKGTERQVLPAVVVGRELAKTLRVFVGDEVNVVSPLGGMGPMGPIPKARPYRVGGVFFSGMYQDDAKNAYVRLDVAQRFLGMEGKISGLRVRLEQIEDAGPVADELRELLGPRYRVRSWEEVNANLFSALRLEKIAMFALYSVFFIICAFLIASTLTMMVLEKRRGIAVLKTLGASNLRLGLVFMLQGVVAGLVGTVSGQIAAFLQCLALRSFVEIDPGVYYISHLPVTMEPAEFATVAGLALLTAAAATILPLAATVVLRPVDGLRQ